MIHSGKGSFMADHPNVDIVRRGYKAFGEGDMETLAELMAEEAVWHLGGNNALTGDYKGRENVFGLFGKLAEMSEGTMSIELHDVLANDEHAVALTTVTAAGSSGKTLSVNSADSMHISNGQITEFWTFGSDEAAWDAYFSG
jgi:ketosteroid isomerase-like protein